MIERRIVRRYAAALFNAAEKAKMVDRVESDLGLISYALETSPNLLDAMISPLIPAFKKRSVVQSIFKDNLAEITISYLYLLIDHQREEAMLQTEEEYLELANEARGIMSAEVITAIHLNEDEEVKLKEKLDDMTGKRVRLEKRIDPGIIGGVVIKIGDRVIDGSIKGRLAAIKEKLVS